MEICLSEFAVLESPTPVHIHEDHICLQLPTETISFSSPEKYEVISNCRPSEVLETFKSHGILGFFEFEKLNYLAFVTEVSKVGKVLGYWIYRAERFRVVPFDQSEPGESDDWRALAEQGFSYASPIYFSRFPLYSRIGEKWAEYVNGRTTKLDSEFIWNKTTFTNVLALSTPLKKFVVPAISGNVSLKEVGDVTYVLVSRRSSSRSGTRFTRRGLDDKGACANYCETEQLLLKNDHVRSVLITRGSVPVNWRQTISMKYTPKISLLHDHTPSKAHFDFLKERYGEVACVSLLNHKGIEKPLNDEYSVVAEENGVPLTKFDFHTECSKMRWENLDKLVDGVHDTTERFRFSDMQLGSNGKWKLHQNQVGVFRVNCLDSLDRCNVSQNLLSSETLHEMKKGFGSVDWENPETKREFEVFLRNAWADNADALSMGYCGTPAQKTDFTRTGKRTRWGKLRDLTISLQRYWKNNFTDGQNQDAMDLSLGKVRNYTSESYGLKPSYLSLLPAVLIPSLLSQVSTILGKKITTLATVFLVYVVVKYFGRSFVNKAKLLEDETKPFIRGERDEGERKKEE